MASQLRHDGLPDSLLGCAYRTWKQTQLRVVLEHYDEPYVQQSKYGMWRALHYLCQQRPELKAIHKARILNPDYWNRRRPLDRSEERLSIGSPNNVDNATREGSDHEAQVLTLSLYLNDASADTPGTQDEQHVEKEGHVDGGFSDLDATLANSGEISTEATISAQDPNTDTTAIAATRECTVCYEAIAAENLFQRNVTSARQHEPDICRQCIAQSISSQIATKAWDHIDSPSCGERLDH